MSANNNIQKKNLYLVLDLSSGASQNDILHAYNRARRTYSQDSVASYSLFDEEDNEAILQEIENAYEILGNPTKRKEYDLAHGFDGAVPSESPENFEPQEIPTKEFAREKSESSMGENTERIKQSAKSVSLINTQQSPSVKVKKTPEFEKEIDEAVEMRGDFLKAVRLYRGYTEEQLAQLCCLSPNHIINIENEIWKVK